MTVFRVHTTRSVAWMVISLAAVLSVACVVSLSIGSVSISPKDILRIIISLFNPHYHDRDLYATVLIDIRMPRVLLGVLVGGGLAVAGVVFQVLLRNPLAEPYILGISGGASVGALISMALGVASWFAGAMSLFAFIGALLVVVLVYMIGMKSGVLESEILLLAGVMVGAFLSAIVLALVVVIGDPVRNVLFWLLGNLGMAQSISVIVLVPFMAVVVFVLYLMAHAYNAIALGEETALQLGVPVRKVVILSYVVASLITGVLVSLSGAIGFVGLIVPHVCRKLFGPDHRVLIPASFLVGGIVLVLADLLARMLLAPVELPVGAVTAVIGAPFFILLLKTERG